MLFLLVLKALRKLLWVSEGGDKQKTMLSDGHEGPGGALSLRGSLSRRCQWPSIPLLGHCLHLPTSETNLEDVCASGAQLRDWPFRYLQVDWEVSELF